MARVSTDVRTTHYLRPRRCVHFHPTSRGSDPSPDHHYAQLLASIDGIVWEADAHSFQLTYVSEQAERLLGYPLGEWYTPNFWPEHLHPDDRDWAVAFCVAATLEMRLHDFEYRMIAADGRVVWLRDIVTVVVEGGVSRPRSAA